MAQLTGIKETESRVRINWNISHNQHWSMTFHLVSRPRVLHDPICEADVFQIGSCPIRKAAT